MPKTIAYSPYGGRNDNIHPFEGLFDKKVNPTIKGNLNDVDALLLWGGEDIHPTFYRQKAHRSNDCYNKPDISHRDMMEWHMIKECHAKNIPIIGICRGAQLLCAYAGGTLIQDVNGHYSGHEIITEDGLSMHAPANHHQMMNPTGTTYELLAWTAQPLSTYYREETDDSIETALFKAGCDPEVIWFPEIKGLAIQPHPEWGPMDTAFTTWCIKQVRKYILKEE